MQVKLSPGQLGVIEYPTLTFHVLTPPSTLEPYDTEATEEFLTDRGFDLGDIHWVRA